MGFSFSGAAPNNGPDLHPAQGRTRSASGRSSRCTAVLNRIRGPMFGIPGAIVVPFAPPAIKGLSTFGGFQFEVLDQTGGDIAGLGRGPRRRSSAARQRVGAGDRAVQQLPRRRPAAGGRHRSRQGPRPRPAAARGHRRASVFLGSQYVNDFDFNNRAYRVYVQADQAFRAKPERPAADLRARRGRPDGAARHRSSG